MAAGTGVHGCTLTPALIKHHAGQFDLETVGTLHYTGKGLPRISGLDECVNLGDINFSDNALQRIEGLDTLTKLRKLVLTNNSIRRVENLQQLQTLEHLLLQGNQIASLDDLNLPLLESLPKLVSLYLRNVDNTQANPVCACKDYKASILRRLPHLRNLDGERLRSTAHAAFREAAAEPEPVASGTGGGGGAVGGAERLPVGFWDLEGGAIDFSTSERALRAELDACGELNHHAKALIAKHKPYVEL